MDKAEVLTRYRNWHYKNTFLLLVSLLLLWYFADSEVVKNFIDKIGALGYLGAFITGVLFTSVFTALPAVLVLFVIANELNPFFTALLAGTGAVLGDYLIFRFLKDRIFKELEPVFLKLGGSNLIKLFKTPFFAWAIPFLGAAIIASPLPDEVGIGILGLSRVKNWQFLLLSFVLNALGVLIIVSLARVT